MACDTVPGMSDPSHRQAHRVMKLCLVKGRGLPMRRGLPMQSERAVVGAAGHGMQAE